MQQNMDEEFNTICEKLKNNTDLKLDNETRLKFYGLYKVATVGKYDNKTHKAGFFDFDGKYKK
jgi:acyl-CoA-binding protein